MGRGMRGGRDRERWREREREGSEGEKKIKNEGEQGREEEETGGEEDGQVNEQVCTSASPGGRAGGWQTVHFLVAAGGEGGSGGGETGKDKRLGRKRWKGREGSWGREEGWGLRGYAVRGTPGTPRAQPPWDQGRAEGDVLALPAPL